MRHGVGLKAHKSGGGHFAYLRFGEVPVGSHKRGGEENGRFCAGFLEDGEHFGVVVLVAVVKGEYCGGAGLYAVILREGVVVAEGIKYADLLLQLRRADEKVLIYAVRFVEDQVVHKDLRLVIALRIGGGGIGLALLSAPLRGGGLG